MEQPNREVCKNNPNAEVISVDALNRGDRVLVQTQRSLYRFSISDAPRRRGLLTGGSLGDQTVEATFAGSILNDCVEFDSWELKPGFRAVFFIQKGRITQRLMTSLVTEVNLVRNNLIEECAA